MGSYNAKPISSDDKEKIQPPTATTQNHSNSHPFTIEDTSDTDGNETDPKESARQDFSQVRQLPTSSEPVMQDEQRQRELALERHRDEQGGPSHSSPAGDARASKGDPVPHHGLFTALAASEGSRVYPAVAVTSGGSGSSMNPVTLPLLQYQGQPAPPLVAINPTTAAVFSPYPSAFTSPTAAAYSSLHSSSNPRPYHAIESYSAMLASMGNQAQQHLQGHLLPSPSYFQGGYMSVPAQYAPISPLLTGVVPTSKGMFPEGSYLSGAVTPHILTGILPSGSLVHPAGTHLEKPGEAREGATPDKHHTRLLADAREREQHLLESRRMAEMSQMSPSAQGHRAIPEARVSPFQQSSSSYRVAIPNPGDHLDGRGPGVATHSSKAVHLESSQDMILHTTTSKPVIGGGSDTSRQVQLALLPNSFYCGTVPGQTMVTTTEGTIRVELPPPTVGINIGTRPQQIANPISKPTPAPSSTNSTSIFTFPSSTLPPLTSISSGPPVMHSSITPSAGPFPGTAPRHHSPTYSQSAVQSWHLSPTPQVRPTPSVKFPGHNSSIATTMATAAVPGILMRTHPEADQEVQHVSVGLGHGLHPNESNTVGVIPSALTPQGGETHLHPTADTTQTSPGSQPAQPQRPYHQSTSTLPSYFTRGSIIQLANSVLKRVEDLTTDDFVQSASSTDGLKIDSSTVLRIEEEPHKGLALIGFLVGEHKAQVTVEAPYEHPFFVFGQGWSSVRPELSLKYYGLQCHNLAVGDVCVSLTVVEKNGRHMYKEEAGLERHIKSQMHTVTSPDMKRRRTDERFPKHEVADQPTHGTPVVQGLPPSSSGAGGISAHLATSPSLQHDQYGHVGMVPQERVPPHEGAEQKTDKNFNIVPEKVLEMPHMKLMRPPKRRWSDPVKANLNPTDKEGLPQAVAPETLGKVQQQQ